MKYLHFAKTANHSAECCEDDERKAVEEVIRNLWIDMPHIHH